MTNRTIMQIMAHDSPGTSLAVAKDRDEYPMGSPLLGRQCRCGMLKSATSQITRYNSKKVQDRHIIIIYIHLYSPRR